jgi:hypothetical protein
MEQHFLELLFIMEVATEKVCKFLKPVWLNYLRQVAVTCYSYEYQNALDIFLMTESKTP